MKKGSVFLLALLVSSYCLADASHLDLKQAIQKSFNSRSTETHKFLYSGQDMSSAKTQPLMDV